jgi:predicted nucleic acid-binding protein
MALERLAEEGSELWTSRQVLREYLAVLSRPQAFAPPIPVSSLVAEVQHFQQRFQVAEDGIGVTRLLLQLMEQVSIAGKQVHDANIVATMQAHGLRHLLTHNTADFVRFSHLITVVPLEVSP